MQRRLLARLMLALAITAASLTVALAGPAQAGVQKQSPAGWQAGIVPTASAGAQCSLPAAQRHGAWMCAAGGTAPAARPQAVAALPLRTEHCDSWGCWTVFNDFFAEFYSTTIYLGWNNTAFANVHFLVEWHLTGAQSLEYPVQTRVNHYTVHTIFSGALFNGAVGVPGGGSVEVQCGPNTRPAAAANVLVSYPNGCKTYDKTSYDHNQVVEASWTFSEHPGHWFFYVRSPVSHAPDKATFRFHDAWDLSGSSAVGGWNG
jgi:hypothetical protein